MMRSGLFTMVIPAVALFGLLGCGGGATFGGGIGGTGKPGLTLGTVTALGSVEIGGRTYDTSTAAITIDGMAASEADLRLGMVALVEADTSTAVASRVEVDDLVKGPITAIGADTLTVNGQVIEVDEQTVYGPGISPASLAGLTMGDLVEVHGFVKAPGVISGRRVERENSLSEYRVTGFAASIDTGLRTFTIGAQPIDYSAADTSDLTGGHPSVGQLVRVRGLTTLTGLGAIDATEVRGRDLDDEDDNDEVEVEGFVTAVNSPTEFVLGGLTVRTDGGTSYEGGTAGEVVVGVKLEVEGSLANGVLTAREVEFKAGVRVESDVATVVGNVITLVGFPGLSVTVNSLTEYEGDASSLVDVMPGDHLEVRGRATGPSGIAATKIKEESGKTDVRLRGPVDAAPAPADPTFSILGILVDTTGLADGAFRGPSEAVIGRAAFFVGLATGDLVEAQGDLVGGVPVWDKVELEGEDS